MLQQQQQAAGMPMGFAATGSSNDLTAATPPPMDFSLLSPAGLGSLGSLGGLGGLGCYDSGLPNMALFADGLLDMSDASLLGYDAGDLITVSS